MDNEDSLGVMPEQPVEHQTARDIRQWAICEAGRHRSDPEEIMGLAKRYVDFVETGA